MKTNMKLNLTKEQLREQLNKIEEQEEKEMIKERYPEFKKLEGKYFKYLNSYGSDYKKWGVYTKVIEIKPSDLYNVGRGVDCHFTGFSFEFDKIGLITIENIKRGHTHLLGDEISEAEFNAAWNEIADMINKMK